MKRIRLLVSLLLTGLGLSAGAWADLPSAAPEFNEVLEVLRAHFKGMSEAELNQAAVEGLLEQLYPKVLLVEDPDTSAARQTPVVAKSVTLEEAYAYIRIGRLAPGAEDPFRTAFDALEKTNRLRGLILDLRFADGISYVGAKAVANLFFATEQPLINWGAGLQKSTAKDNAIQLPLAILVNAKTTGAAEALAGMLREGRMGLVIGSRTAGEASEFEEFKLKNGQRLRLATAPIKLAGGRELSREGLTPDIPVEVSLEDDRLHLEDAYAELGGASAVNLTADETGETNRLPQRINEAELMRRHRQGTASDIDEETPTRRQSDQQLVQPVIQDPVLARALDLVKGLALIKSKPRD